MFTSVHLAFTASICHWWEGRSQVQHLGFTLWASSMSTQMSAQFSQYICHSKDIMLKQLWKLFWNDIGEMFKSWFHKQCSHCNRAVPCIFHKFLFFFTRGSSILVLAIRMWPNHPLPFSHTRQTAAMKLLSLFVFAHHSWLEKKRKEEMREDSLGLRALWDESKAGRFICVTLTVSSAEILWWMLTFLSFSKKPLSSYSVFLFPQVAF